MCVLLMLTTLRAEQLQNLQISCEVKIWKNGCNYDIFIEKVQAKESSINNYEHWEVKLFGWYQNKLTYKTAVQIYVIISH